MDELNILGNDEAMRILRDASGALQRAGVHCVLSPMALPQGMSISLHVGSTLQAALAANVASTVGGEAAHAVDSHQQFASQVAYALADDACLKAATGNGAFHANSPSARAFAHQDRLAEAASNAEPLSDEDLEFLRQHVDSLALSVRFHYTEGKWLLERRDDNQWLHDELVQDRERRGRGSDEQPEPGDSDKPLA